MLEGKFSKFSRSEPEHGVRPIRPVRAARADRGPRNGRHKFSYRENSGFWSRFSTMMTGACVFYMIRVRQ